ncbi:hypothetical protein [Tsukamurella hominis]|uniref:hypothetical protein n=1 Tax=Tsukamurella hominis TaxID=1970232 RepID=UPI0039EBB69A
MTPAMLLAFMGVLAVAAEIADRMPVPADKYRRIEDFADCGLGADEYRGPRRYTRPSETHDMRKGTDSCTAKRKPVPSDQLTHQENQ